MSAEKIYHSPYPDVKLPETSCWHFVFDKPNPPEDKVIYVDGLTNRQIKFQELKSLTKRLAYGLIHRAKVRPDDVILAFSENTLLYPAFVQAALASSLCVTLANPTYQVDELVHHIKDAGASVLIVGKPVFKMAKQAALKCGITDHNVYMIEEQDHGGHKSIWSLAGYEELEPRRLSRQEAEQQTAFMCYSSGTTGKAKGVETTHHNVTSVITQLLSIDPSMYTEKERWLAIVPLYHMYGVLTFILVTPYCQATSYILPRFEPELWLQSIQKFRITTGHIVPPLAGLLAKHPIVDKYDFSSMVKWSCGAAPLGNDVIDMVEKRTKVPLRSAYGMTETTCVISVTRLDNAKRGTVGMLLPNMSAKLVDGEIYLKGPNIMKGYLRNPRANAETFTTDGWMKTGDACRFDADENIFIVDRIKELIKYKGFQVPPAELEDLLLSHPDIEDAAVIGVWDQEQTTEIPRAYVVLSARAKGRMNVEKEIIPWVAERVANYKRLRGGIQVLDGIPKNPSGKILRRLLRDRSGWKGVSLKL
ncbi:hypothetical protein PILCRDRAFT_824179 [Piloderma croceum F 1598]|uniref:Acetyl-CoA synthetase-like protein n=1 Tax=Piloderma croceum (strain F 1598) TaxID=765440 RepID=A0A0C3FFN4_PILCF|nr:hypothetical protein PILCRDRAFT_824179 [Piloderma croceum F 1598]